MNHKFHPVLLPPLEALPDGPGKADHEQHAFLFSVIAQGAQKETIAQTEPEHPWFWVTGNR